MEQNKYPETRKLLLKTSLFSEIIAFIRNFYYEMHETVTPKVCLHNHPGKTEIIPILTSIKYYPSLKNLKTENLNDIKYLPLL
jgi:hypothetical protein